MGNTSDSSGISCLPPSNKKKVKKVVQKVVPFSISEKRERLTTWWDNVCNKVHQCQVTKHRNQMHKDLEKQLKSMRQDMESSNSSDVSPTNSRGVVNQTATTSLTCVNDEPSSSAATTAVERPRFKSKITIGAAFNDFQNKTREAQRNALLEHNKNIEKKRKRQAKKQAKKEFKTEQRNRRKNRLDNQKNNENQQQQRKDNNQQQQQRNENQRQRNTYQSDLAPLQEETEGEDLHKETAAAVPQLQTDNNNHETNISLRVQNDNSDPRTTDLSRVLFGNNNCGTTGSLQLQTNNRTNSSSQVQTSINNNRTINSPLVQTGNNNRGNNNSLQVQTDNSTRAHNSSPRDSSSSDSDQSFYSIPEPISSPSQPDITGNLNRFLTDFNFGENNNRPSSLEQQENERPCSTRAQFVRSINSSFRLFSSPSSTSLGHRADPIAERHLPTNMNAYLERAHDGSVDNSPSSPEASTSNPPQSNVSPGLQGQEIAPQPTRVALTTATTAVVTIDTNHVAASGEIIPAFPQENAVVTRAPRQEQTNRYNEPQDHGRPPHATGFSPNMVETRNDSFQVARVLQHMRYFNHREYMFEKKEAERRQFRVNFAQEITNAIQEDNRNLFKNNKNYSSTYRLVNRNNGGGIIGDGINGAVRVVYKIAHRTTVQSSSSRIPEFAMKKVEVDLPNQWFKDAILSEIYIMDRARGHANLMSFTELFYFDDIIRIMMNRMVCDLSDFMAALSEPMPQFMVTHIFSKVVKGLYYLHYDLGYFHGDIKPENILLGTNGQVKLTDFGFSSPCGVVKNGRCGTKDYMAPEVYRDYNFNEKSDLWSLGIMLVSMLNYGLPQLKKDDFLSAEFVVIFTTFGHLFQDMDINPFIRPIFDHCLTMDPRARCTIAELDDYFNKYSSKLFKENGFPLEEYVARYMLR